MMLTNSLLLALAASTASASYNVIRALQPAAQAARRDILAARQTQTGDDDGGAAATACVDGLESIFSSVPTPPPEILSWESTADITDPCSVTVPASLSRAFSSYESEALSWFSQHSADYFSVLSQCPQLSGVVQTDLPTDTCDGGGAAATTGAGDDDSTTTTRGGGVTTTTTDASGNTQTTTTSPRTTGTTSNGGSRTTGTTGTSTTAAATVSPNAAPMQTGFVAGAMAVAGLLGVVAAL